MQNMTRKLFLAALFALLPLELAAAPKDNYPEPTTVSDEDSDYVKCLQAATEFTDDETALCMDGEIKRLDRALNNLYRNVFLKEERIQKWNNGNGMFRGNGHTISGLRVTGNEDHSGLFKVIGGSGSVSDLIITGAEISGSGYDGIVAGENLGTISSVTVSGTVSESGIAGGGIAGRNRGTIMSCSSSASAKGNGDVGGITGVNYGTVKDCTASGTLSGEYPIGGIAGLNTDGAVISSC